MIVKRNNKSYNIDDEELDSYVERLEISLDEAVDLWLCDNDLEENEEQKHLTKIAQDNRITSTIHQASSDVDKKKKKKVAVEDTTKEGIISYLAKCLEDKGIAATVTNKSKIIEFELNGEQFKLDLIRRRNK